jgi:hypothetical protein
MNKQEAIGRITRLIHDDGELNTFFVSRALEELDWNGADLAAYFSEDGRDETCQEMYYTALTMVMLKYTAEAMGTWFCPKSDR